MLPARSPNTIRQKSRDGVFFSVGMVVFVIDALRLAVGDGGVVSEAALYDALEPAIAVTISCLPTCRRLTSTPGDTNKCKAKQIHTSIHLKVDRVGKPASRQDTEAKDMSLVMIVTRLHILLRRSEPVMSSTWQQELLWTQRAFNKKFIWTKTHFHKLASDPKLVRSA